MTEPPDREEPDLEALVRMPSPMPELDAAQRVMIESLSGLHWAWYCAWKAHGFTEEQAFRLARDMINNASRS